MTSSSSGAARPADQPSSAPAPQHGPTNVLVVGVGGQGVIMVSKVLASICQGHGHEVKQSEVHGMAKRGGTVFSHVRFGGTVYSPTIPQGEADVLVALEWAEGLRWLPWLRPERGTFIVDTQRIVPPFACRDRRVGAVSGYARASVAEVVATVPNALALDASGIAEQLGNARAGNTVLLGALSTALDFSTEEWNQAIADFVPAHTRAINREAFTSGRQWVLDGAPAPDSAGAAPVGEQPGSRAVDLQINEAWCKSCDICVKVCPERCLALDERRIAVLARPDACTGCHLCEWLCPDFAISVHVGAAA